MVNFDDIEFSMLNEHSDICADCLNFKDFGDKCWYFWVSKKQCSQKLKSD